MDRRRIARATLVQMQPACKLTYPNFCYRPATYPCCAVLRQYANNDSVGDATTHELATPWPQTLVYSGRTGRSLHSNAQRNNPIHLSLREHYG